MPKVPRKSQKRRTLAQEAQTNWMRSFRHDQPSPNEADTFQLPDSLSDARAKEKLRREVAEEKRGRLNCERHEKRTKEKVEKLEEEADGMEIAMQLTSDENVTLRENLEEVTRRSDELKREVGLLTAKFNSRIRREPQKIETAVKRALSSVFVTEQTVYKVKTPDGTIQN